MASFDEYYRQALREFSGSAPSAPRTPSVSTNNSGSGIDLDAFKSASNIRKTMVPETPMQQASTWLLDMLNRPLSSVLNPIQQGFNEIDKAREEAERGEEPNVAGAVGNILGAGLRGWFSPSQEDRADTSRLIEQGTDTFGKLNDPDYVDRQDNVNPVLKGSLGFAGDVLADPLTWIPGGIIAKGANKALGSSKALEASLKAKGIGAETANAARKAGASGKDARSAGKAAREAAERESEDIDDLFDPSLINAMDNVDSPTTFTRGADDVIQDSIPRTKPAVQYLDGDQVWLVPKTTSASKALIGERPEPVMYTFDKGVFRSPEGNAVPESKLSEFVVQPQQIVATPPRYMPSVSQKISTAPKADTLRQVFTRLEPEERAKDIYAQMPDRNAWASTMFQKRGHTTFKAPVPTSLVDDYARKTYDLTVDPKTQSVAMDWSQASRLVNDPKAPKKLREYLNEEIDTAYEKWFKRAKRSFDHKATTASPALDTDSAASYFQKVAKHEEAALRAALGSRAYSNLLKMNPENFDNTVKQVTDILDGHAPWVDEVFDNADLDPTVRSMLDHIGVDPAALNTDRLLSIVKDSEGIPLVGKDGEPIHRMVNPVDFATSQSVKDVLNEVLPKHLRDSFDLSRYEELRPSGALATSASKGTENARALFENQWNMRDASQLLERSQNATLRRIEKLGEEGRKVPMGRDRQAFVRKGTLENLSIIEGASWRAGIPHYAIGMHDKRLPMFTSHVIRHVSDQDSKIIDYALFNGGTKLPASTFLQAVERALDGGSLDDVKEAIINPPPLFQGGKKQANFDKHSNFSKGGVVGHVPNNMKVPEHAVILGRSGDKVTSFTTGDGLVYNRGKKGGWSVNISGKQAVDRMAAAIMQAKDDLVTQAAANRIQYVQRFQEDLAEMSEAVTQRMRSMLADIDNGDMAAARQFILDASDIPKFVKKASYEKGVFNEVNLAIQALMKNAEAPGVEETSKALVKMENTAKRAKVTDPKNSVRQETELRTALFKEGEKQARLAQEFADDVARRAVDSERASARAAGESEDAMRFEELDEVYEIGSSADSWNRTDSGKVASGISERMGRLGDPLRRRFDPKYGVAGVYDSVHGLNINTKAAVDAYHGRLNKIAKDFGKFIPDTDTSYYQRAWYNLTKDIQDEAIADPTELAATVAMREALNVIIDTSQPGSLITSGLMRSESSIPMLNKAWEEAGLGQFADMDLLARTAKENGTSLWEAAAQAWKTWDVEDPLHLLTKAHGAMTKLHFHKSVMDNFAYNMRKSGLLSDTPKSGYARLGAKGTSALGEFLPKNAYFPKAALSEIRRLDEILQMSKQIDGEIGKFIHKDLDPVLDAWKYAITLPRPGHHVRNWFGDMSMTYVAEGRSYLLKGTKDAIRILWANKGAKAYTDVDFSRMLQQLGDTNLPKTGEVMSSGKIGKFHSDEIFEAANRHGIMPTFHVDEDFLGGTKGRVKTVADAITFRGGKIEKGLGKASEARDHAARVGHFMQIIHKANKKGHHNGTRFSSPEELFDYAGKRVKRFHPDGAQLTSFESKYMRRIIPFYTWFRGALPALFTSALENPGRVALFPKLSYNVAVATGVNPESFVEPFPEDQMFPSFLTASLTGPQFVWGDRYISGNPGIAYLDMWNSLSPEPLRGVAGMVNPFVRMPAEMLSGGSWGTGGNINDNSDYIDSAIPGINYLGNLSGYSPTGSVVSFLQGKGLDPQLQVERENKGPFDAGLSAANWLLGSSFQNVSRPNYINFAEIERRNAEAAKESDRSAF